jgi:hypothetical protein
MIDKDHYQTNNDENDEDKLEENMKDKEKETNKANPDEDKNKPDQDMKDKLDEDTNDGDKPDKNMKDKEKETNKDKSDGDNDETDKDESDEEMNDRDDKDQPDGTMTDGQKNLMVTYKPNTTYKSPKMLRHAYTYKTSNDGKRNDSIQNHHEFASFVDESFIVNKKAFVDVPKDYNITINKVNCQLEKQLLMKSKDKQLTNHYSHDELLYAKNARAINTRFSYHETEINARLEALAKEKQKCKNRDKRREMDLQIAALMEEKTVLQESIWTEHFLAHPDSLVSL